MEDTTYESARIYTRIGGSKMLVILISFVISFLVSFSMMKFQMKMLEKWMDVFFEEELIRIKKIIDKERKSE